MAFHMLTLHDQDTSVDTPAGTDLLFSPAETNQHCIWHIHCCLQLVELVAHHVLVQRSHLFFLSRNTQFTCIFQLSSGLIEHQLVHPVATVCVCWESVSGNNILKPIQDTSILFLNLKETLRTLMRNDRHATFCIKNGKSQI